MIAFLALALATSAVTQPAVTDCDRLAAHPNDPDKVAPGVAQKDMDLSAAVAACQVAVRKDPQSGRFNYQLARALGYSGRGKEAAGNHDAAVKADYPQALFVVGYIHLFGLNDAEKDVCKAGDLIRRSALKGRQAGLVGFPHWAQQGRFSTCPVLQDKAEMAGFLKQARAQAEGDFYQTILIESVEARLR